MPPAYSFIQQNSEYKYYVTITKFSAFILFNVFDNIWYRILAEIMSFMLISCIKYIV